MKTKIIPLIIVIAVVVVGAVVLFSLPRTTVEPVFNFVSETTCKARHGTTIEAGCGIGGCSYKCVVPYRDGGKSCVRTSDCSGHCLVASPAMPNTPDIILGNYGILNQCVKLDKGFDCAALKPIGQCQKMEMANCESGWELNDGKVMGLSAKCML